MKWYRINMINEEEREDQNLKKEAVSTDNTTANNYCSDD